MSALTAVALLGAALAAELLTRRLGRSKRASRAWSEAARRLGGRYHDGRTTRLSRRQREIHARVDGVRVVIACQVVSVAGLSLHHTRAHVRGIVASQLDLELHRGGLESELMVAPRLKTVETDDPTFDGAVVLKGNDAPLVKAWLDAPARKACLGSVAELVGTGDDGVFFALCPGVLTDADELEALAWQVAQVATGGQRLLARWRTVAETVGGHVEGAGDDWPVRGGARATLWHHGRWHAQIVATRDDQGQSCTLVCVELAKHAQEAFAVARRSTSAGGEPRPRVGDGYEVLSGGASVWTPQRVTELERLCPARVAREGAEVRVTLDGVEPDPERWRQALDLAARLADDQGGAYR